jgi:hypothetical protein
MSNIFVTNQFRPRPKRWLRWRVLRVQKGSTVEIPEQVATHIFGYKDEDKIKYLARLGWAKTSNELEMGLERLSKWELSTQPPKKNQLSPLVERVPLPSQKKAGGKVLQAVA